MNHLVITTDKVLQTGGWDSGEEGKCSLQADHERAHAFVYLTATVILLDCQFMTLKFFIT